MANIAASVAAQRQVRGAGAGGGEEIGAPAALVFSGTLMAVVNIARLVKTGAVPIGAGGFTVTVCVAVVVSGGVALSLTVTVIVTMTAASPADRNGGGS